MSNIIKNDDVSNIRSQIEDEDDFTFLNLRDTLFEELTEDVVIEIADMHCIPAEFVPNSRRILPDEDCSDEDKNGSKNLERLIATKMGADPCCGNDCFQNFDEKALARFARSLDSCSKSEAEAALLMNMFANENETGLTKRGSSRKRRRVMYSVKPFGNMCRESYLRLWGIGERTLRNLKSYQKTNPGRFAPRVHGNANKTSSRTLPPLVRESVVRFVNDFGNEAGEESGGRHMRRNNRAAKNGVVRFLPAFYSVALLYRLFLARCREEKPDKHSPPLSIRQFYYIFRSPECAGVQLRSPRNDVCDICLLYRNRIRRDTGIVDENDENQILAWNDHVSRAKKARNVYRKEIAAARDGFEGYIGKRNRRKEYVPHASFDFAQNLGLPQLADQPRELYFASQRSVRVFSIRDDGANVQYNFLYDEGDGGKGGNYVASMLILYLLDLKKRFRVKKVLLNADNCCSQNKNNIVLWVLDSLTMLGVFDRIELKFLVKGHTHCSVDGGHGLIKKEWRKRDVFSIRQTKELIEQCSDTQRAIILSPKEFHDWSSFLKPFFVKLAGISYQQQFRFDSQHFGRIFYRGGHGLRWQSQSLLKNELRKLPEALSSLKLIKKHLNMLKAPGIPARKQWDLYKKVRKFVPDKFKDELCPKPEIRELAGNNK